MKKFDVTECAAYVIQTVNVRFYSKLLVAIECEALRRGYAFEEGTGDTPPLLPPELRDALGAALLRAKVQILAPALHETDVNDYVERRTDDDEGRPWLDEILFALHLRGVRLIRCPANVAIGEAMADHQA